tara:strand:- start:1739 stop:2170 length:432 start_codon:yes stop_codon:yes gene_type:complete
MATFTGHDGVVKFADTDDSLTLATVGNLRNFTIEQTQDTIEDTTMGSTGMRTYKPGLSTFTISGDVFFDGGDGVQAKLDELVSKVDGESNATFEVYPSGTAGGNTKLSGSCIITSFSITSSVDGMVEASFAAQGTGSLTLAQL